MKYHQSREIKTDHDFALFITSNGYFMYYKDGKWVTTHQPSSGIESIIFPSELPSAVEKMITDMGGIVYTNVPHNLMFGKNPDDYLVARPTLQHIENRRKQLEEEATLRKEADDLIARANSIKERNDVR